MRSSRFVLSHARRVRRVRRVRQVRRLLGALLVLHGLAHTLAGTRVTDTTRWDGAGSGLLRWAASFVWGIASVGLVTGGMGLLGTPAFGRYWRRAGFVGVVSSLLLLTAFGAPARAS